MTDPVIFPNIMDQKGVFCITLHYAFHPVSLFILFHFHLLLHYHLLFLSVFSLNFRPLLVLLLLFVFVLLYYIILLFSLLFNFLTQG
jgi:hypothetical protein